MYKTLINICAFLAGLFLPFLLFVPTSHATTCMVILPDSIWTTTGSCTDWKVWSNTSTADLLAKVEAYAILNSTYSVCAQYFGTNYQYTASSWEYDTDCDGVGNSTDECPDVYGLAANGCPLEPAHCSDGVQNSDTEDGVETSEDGIDCGGPCSAECVRACPQDFSLVPTNEGGYTCINTNVTVPYQDGCPDGYVPVDTSFCVYSVQPTLQDTDLDDPTADYSNTLYNSTTTTSTEGDTTTTTTTEPDGSESTTTTTTTTTTINNGDNTTTTITTNITTHPDGSTTTETISETTDDGTGDVLSRDYTTSTNDWSGDWSGDLDAELQGISDGVLESDPTVDQEGAATSDLVEDVPEESDLSTLWSGYIDSNPIYNTLAGSGLETSDPVCSLSGEVMGTEVEFSMCGELFTDTFNMLGYILIFISTISAYFILIVGRA